MAVVALATSPQRQLRVGLFADAELQPRWLIEAFAKVAGSDFAEIAVIATLGHPRTRSAPRGEPWLAKLYGSLDRRFFGAGNAEERLELAAQVPHNKTIKLEKANPLTELDLDVAFALGDFDDSALDGVARHGVWRLQADGAREVAEGAPLSGSSLRARLSPGAESKLVYQSWSRTYPLSVARNRGRLLRKTAEFPWRALRELQRSGAEWLEQCKTLANAQAAEARAAAGLSTGAFLPSLAGRMLRRGIEKALRVEHWFMAFRFLEANGDDPRAIPGDLAGFTRIVPPRDRIWADPFPLERGGRYFVFFEEMAIASGKGHIAVIELGRDGRWGPPQRVLERDYHLSYPFLLEHGGELYMIPETADHRTVELYRCVDFPLRWKLERTLLEDVRLVDATLVRRSDRWWMFANAAPPGWSLNDELSLFHAEDLLGPWQPHSRNPVKSDVRCARPAGNLYWRNGALYRPAQICAPDYGSGLSINRVLRLTPHEYAERQVARVLPSAREGLLGIHTVNRAGELTVIDAWSRRGRLG